MAAPGQVSFDSVCLDYRIFHDRTLSLLETMLNLFGRRTRTERLRALEGVTFSLAPGESVALIGANGAGKSTTLKLLAGIYEPTSGRVEVSGRIASLLDLGVGFHPELTALENLYLNGALMGFDRRAMKAMAPSIVEFAELERFVDTPVKYFSAGMFMRLGFSLATACSPDILVIDEVLAVGDASFQRKCYDRIFGFRGQGRTIVFVSHDTEAVSRLCERAIWLESGRIRADGPVLEVLPEYLSAASSRHSAASVAPREWGSREVWLDRVRITDDRGNPTAVFRQGSKLFVEALVRTRVEGGVDGVVFGFSIHRPDGEPVIGVNNLELNEPLLEVRGCLETRIGIDLEVLEPGAFVLGLALTDPVEHRDYHWQEFFYPLQVLGERHDPPLRLREAIWETGPSSRC